MTVNDAVREGTTGMYGMSAEVEVLFRYGVSIWSLRPSPTRPARTRTRSQASRGLSPEGRVWRRHVGGR